MTTDTPTPTPSGLPPIEELIRDQATAPKFALEDGYVPRGLPPAPELQWDGDEPFLPVGETGVRITPYRATEEDYADCERISNHPDVARWSRMRQYPYTRADAVKWFGMHIPRQKAAAAVLRDDPNAEIEHLPVMVIRDSRGRLAGDVGVWREPEGSSSFEVGYVLDPALHGRGIGRAAVATMLAWARAHMKPTDFHSAAQTVNIPSNRVLASLGFVMQGVREEPWPEHTGGGKREVVEWRLEV